MMGKPTSKDVILNYNCHIMICSRNLCSLSLLFLSRTKYIMPQDYRIIEKLTLPQPGGVGQSGRN